MSQTQIAIVVGSLRKDSFNRQLAHAIMKLAPAGVHFKEVAIGDLPLYNQDADGNEVAQVKQFRDALRSVDGVLFVTPEYNRSFSGVLKNAIDQASRPYGQSKWKGKPAAIVSVSPSPLSASMAAQHLRNVVAVLGMPTLNLPEMYIQWKDGLVDANGDIGPASREFAQTFVNAFVDWVRRFKQ